VTIRELRRRADRNAEEAGTMRQAMQSRLKRSLSILRRKTGSPAGLVTCFAIGIVAGTRSGARSARAAGNDIPRASALVGQIGTRLISALIAGSLLKSAESGGDSSSSVE
jgi:hypothetical protein